MEKRIELERRARKADQITELILDNCRSTSIVGLTNEYTALETLSLINVGLTTLKGFPVLPNLKRLELSDNRISNGLNHLVVCGKLQYLNLSGNKIQKLETLKPLQQLRNLVDLDLFNNEATRVKDYREQVFAMLPTLKYLDGFDRNDEEANLEDDDEANANGSDEDDEKRTSFCLNGLEIDLAELEEFEQRLAAKKKNSNASAKREDEEDDLDLYLRDLKLKEAEEKSCTSDTKASLSTDTSTVITNETTTTQITSSDEQANETKCANRLSFVLLLYWFLAVLNLAQIAQFPTTNNHNDSSHNTNNKNKIKNNYSGSDDDEYGDEEDEYDEVMLSEVYNEDDMEENYSEYDGEDPGEDYDDEIESDDDDVESDDEEGGSPAKKSVTTKGGKAGAKESAATTNHVSANESSSSSKVASKTTSASGSGKKGTGEELKENSNANNTEDEAAVSANNDDETHGRGKKRKHDG